MKQLPILILSDAPDQTSGLARITRDLATLLSRMPEFRVATLGFGGRGAAEFPWQQYQMYPGEYGELSLPYVWGNFSQGDGGAVFTIFDLSRLLWLARPEYAPDGTREWLQEARGQRKRLQLWSYLPIDSTGPMDRLTGTMQAALLGIDRVLAYSPWGLDVVKATIGAEAGKRDASWLPHPINTAIFQPPPVYTLSRPTNASEAETDDGLGSHPSQGSQDGVPRIGCVMTNQPRKDYGLLAAICRGLVDRLEGKVRFWWHVDMPIRYWNIPALIEDFELTGHVEVTTAQMCGDEWLAAQYRKCNLTILPTSEGFGYPIFESFSCGVPCIHGTYAGGGSLMVAFGLEQYLVHPVEWRIEGQHNSLRPVFDPQDWVDTAMAILTATSHDPVSQHVDHLSMMKLGHVWMRWFREGI